MHAVIQIGVEEEVTLIKEAAAKSTSDRGHATFSGHGGQGQCISVQFSLVAKIWAQNINTKAIYTVHVGTCVWCLIGWLSGGSNNDKCRHIYQNPKHTDTNQ